MTKKLAFVLSAALAACTGSGSGEVQYAGSANLQTPELVSIDPDVQVVADAEQPVFYTDNSYWLYRDNTWYRSQQYQSPQYLDGWVRVEAPPARLRHIDRPEAYVHYRGNQGSRGTYSQRDQYNNGTYNTGAPGRDQYNRDQYNRDQYNRDQYNHDEQDRDGTYNRDRSRDRYNGNEPQPYPQVPQSTPPQGAPGQTSPTPIQNEPYQPQSQYPRSSDRSVPQQPSTRQPTQPAQQPYPNPRPPQQQPPMMPPAPGTQDHQVAPDPTAQGAPGTTTMRDRDHKDADVQDRDHDRDR